jgi:RNA polymerase sigma-B factor
MQDLYTEIRRTEPRLAQELGRTPTTADLAQHLDIPTDDVDLGRRGETIYTTRSLNTPAGGDGNSELGDFLGQPDRALEAVADRDALRRAWPMLPDRQRVILSLRFVDELSQVQIAEKMGMSQMHVSRLITRSLTALRRHMLAESPGATNRF